MATVVSHIGLSEQETVLLKSMFNLLSSSSKISDIIFEPTNDAKQLPDIILVNGDHENSLDSWHSLSNENKCITPIFVTNNPDKYPQAYKMNRPIAVKRLMSALEDVTQTVTNKQATNQPESASELTILVVDDSFPIRKYMEHTLPTLTGASLTVEFASNGEEALEKMLTSTYDLVFLDVMMPGINGYKACKTIKSLYNSCVVMLTGKKSPFDKVRGTMSGCNSYVTKPPENSRLKTIVEECINQRANTFN